MGMSISHCKGLLGATAAAAAMIVLSVPPASAMDALRHHGRHPGFFDEAGRFPHREALLAGISVNGLPTHIPGLGTYVGAISAVRDRGNGNYFALEDGLGMADLSIDRGAAKIIHVTPETAAANCRYEYGVCIIRP